MTSEESELFDCGIIVFETHSLKPAQADLWVGEIRAISGQPVAWFTDRGNLIIKALGNVERARVAIRLLKNMHDELFASNYRGTLSAQAIDSILSAIWQLNKK